MHIEKVLVKLVRIQRGAEVEEELCEVGARGGGGVGREEVAVALWRTMGRSSRGILKGCVDEMSVWCEGEGGCWG